VVLCEARLRAERTVTVDGMDGRFVESLVRGDERGGVDVGAGSFDRAVCTLSSSFCILPIRPLIWCKDLEDVFGCCDE
jgi:hypothetical protein